MSRNIVNVSLMSHYGITTLTTGWRGREFFAEPPLFGAGVNKSQCVNCLWTHHSHM